jgi:hypothetical protein
LPRSGEPQLSDFSMATLEDVAAQAEAQVGFFQTRMSYAAPEVTRGAPACVSGDIYSLALLLYRLLAGANPLRGRSIPETLQRVLQLSPARLVIPDWEGADALNRTLERALAKDPKDRHATCAELEQELSLVQGVSDASVSAELRALIREHFSADWAQVARLTRARRSLPPSRNDAPPAAVAGDSRVPAVVSGLQTDQPVSVSEHALAAATAAEATSGDRRKRARKRRVMAPTVLVPAAAIVIGLGLGRARRAEYRAAFVQNAGRVLRRQRDVLHRVIQSLVALEKADAVVTQPPTGLRGTADDGIQSRAIATTGEDTDTFGTHH